jgi:hypothetical protein
MSQWDIGAAGLSNIWTMGCWDIGIRSHFGSSLTPHPLDGVWGLLEPACWLWLALVATRWAPAVSSPRALLILGLCRLRGGPVFGKALTLRSADHGEVVDRVLLVP